MTSYSKRATRIRGLVLLSLFISFFTIVIVEFDLFSSEEPPPRHFCPIDMESVPYPPELETMIDYDTAVNSASTDLPTKTIQLDYLTELKGISAYTWSPNSMILAVAVSEVVRLFDVDQQEYVHTLQEHNREIHLVQFSPDGRLLASQDRDGLIKVRDILTGEEFIFETEDVAPIAFSPDSSALAFSRYETVDSYPRHRLQVVDIKSGRVLNNLPFSKIDLPVTSINFDPKGDFLVYGTYGTDSYGKAEIVIWNLNTNERVFSWQGPLVPVINAQFDSTGSFLLASLPGGTHIWDCNGKTVEYIVGVTINIRYHGKLYIHDRTKGDLAVYDWKTGSQSNLASDKDYSLSYEEKYAASQNADLTLWSLNTN